LESLQLKVASNGTAISRAFRPHSGPGTFPVLREFAFILLGDDEQEEREDPELFLAVAEVFRGHPMLEALCLSYRFGKLHSNAFGYTAAIWGVLPSLVHLRTLSMDVPQDLPPALGGWLVPRTVVALEVRVHKEVAWKIACAKLLPNLPSGLTFLAVPSMEGLRGSVFPALRLVYASKSFQTVHHTSNGREFRHMGQRQDNFYLEDWLKQLNCEEVGFLYSNLLGFGGRRYCSWQ